MRTFTLACVLGLAMTLAASAATIVVPSDGADQEIRDGGTAWVGGGEIRVGMGTTVGTVGVFVFELPALPDGETVASADFAFSIVKGNNYNALFEKGLDVYALRMNSSSAAALTDYYMGDYDGDASATAIQDYIVFETESLNQGNPGQMGRFDTSTEAEAALGAWVQSMYDDASYDPNGSNYVFIRLNSRANLTNTYRYWTVASANYSTVEDRPSLSITTIPEPATAGLLAFGALALIRRRR